MKAIRRKSTNQKQPMNLPSLQQSWLELPVAAEQAEKFRLMVRRKKTTPDRLFAEILNEGLKKILSQRLRERRRSQFTGLENSNLSPD